MRFFDGIRWWSDTKNDELIHLRLENTRLLGIIETLLLKPPVPLARITDARPRVEPEWQPAKGGVTTRTQALTALQDFMNKKNEKAKDNEPPKRTD